ncbi:MAG: deoxyribonuclease IV [Planctomycetaceae bacterium]|nr:MAG: deoxyribonuclease IV [Planctomycetaceae bacterium]
MDHCLGSHVSVAGGLHLGVQRALDVGCNCLQVFTKNANAWAAKPLAADAVKAWKDALATSGLRHPIAHTSYLINLASPDEGLIRKSIDALVIEWRRAETLGLEGLVLHPGAYTTSDPQTGMARVAAGLVEAFQQTRPSVCRLLLENTAGQGTTLGASLDELGNILASATHSDAAIAPHLGVCLDTCHAFAAGYAIHEAAGFDEFCGRIEEDLPPDSVRAWHLNDSKKPLGSRVDRHEHIGRGEIGQDAFRRLLAHPQLGRLPGYLETEKGTDPETGRDWDAINLEVLRSLIETS